MIIFIMRVDRRTAAVDLTIGSVLASLSFTIGLIFGAILICFTVYLYMLYYTKSRSYSGKTIIKRLGNKKLSAQSAKREDKLLKEATERVKRKNELLRKQRKEMTIKEEKLQQNQEAENAQRRKTIDYQRMKDAIRRDAIRKVQVDKITERRKTVEKKAEEDAHRRETLSEAGRRGAINNTQVAEQEKH